jgi:hypothetical protein|tara:strand:+ start:237 stop:386 length:150 start_codon:yes stop_codon:yes gene_type:complete
MIAYSPKIIKILIYVIKVREKGKEIIAEEYRCEIWLIPSHQTSKFCLLS